MGELRIVDVTEAATFARLPPCADAAFDHRTCDYWEDADRGAKTARPSWLTSARPAEPRPSPAAADNPFLPDPSRGAFATFAAASLAEPMGDDDLFATPEWNPFAPASRAPRKPAEGSPRKLGLLGRGLGVFGSYAKLLLDGETPAAYAQFGPLSAYPRAIRLRELYPRLPQAPLPAVITCIATTTEARSHGHARRLVEAVCEDLAGRGFAAVEAYPDLTLAPDAASAASPGFWRACGFAEAVKDERFPVMRRELG